MSRRRAARLITLALGVLLTAAELMAQPAPAPTTEDCQACHAEPSLTRADNRPVTVPPDAFAASVHAPLACVDCHADLATLTEYPHPDRLKPVDCASCHEDAATGHARSVHAGVTAAQGGPVRCAACHGEPHRMRPAADPESPTNKLRIADTCAQCHGATVAAGQPRGPAVAPTFNDSIHGRALTRTTAAPTCSDCHTNHEIRRPGDAESPVHPLKVPGTCATCHAGQHAEYTGSVHAAALQGGNLTAPQCASCHSAHGITETRGEYQVAAVEQCGTCHREALATYRDSFHGQVTALGFTPVAQCADCHGGHRILRTSDPASTVSPANRLATCRTCHPSANENFARYQPHANQHDPERLPALYYAGRFMTLLLWGVFGFFGLHTLLWFARERTGGDDDGTHRG